MKTVRKLDSHSQTRRIHLRRWLIVSFLAFVIAVVLAYFLVWQHHAYSKTWRNWKDGYLNNPHVEKSPRLSDFEKLVVGTPQRSRAKPAAYDRHVHHYVVYQWWSPHETYTIVIGLENDSDDPIIVNSSHYNELNDGSY